MPQIRSLASAAAALTLAAAATAARADIVMEITPAGEAPDGLVTAVPLDVPGAFDVYIWGTAPEGVAAGLLHADFSVASDERFGWLAMDLGVADPLGLFDTENHGAFGFFPDALLGIAVQSATPVSIPTEMGSALLLYQNFQARPDTAGSVFDVYPVIVDLAGGVVPTVRTVGVIAAPGPSAAALALALLPAAARRTRGGTRPRAHGRV